MKAMVVHQPGSTEVLKLERISDPQPGPKDVVIKVDACGVCYHDIVTRNGTLKFGVQMPCILGHEISGTVVETGRDVRGLRKNDRVATVQRYHICGACRYCRTGREPLCPDRKFTGDWGLVGGYAEYVAIEDDNIAIVPDEIPLQDASIVACTIGTILNAIREIGRLQPGENALVTGAGGGLGMHAVQLARLAGAYVIAQTTSPEKAERIRGLGAHEVIVHRRSRRRRGDRQRGDPAVRADPAQPGHRRPLDHDRAIDRRIRAIQSRTAVPQERINAQRDEHNAQATRGLPCDRAARCGEADRVHGASARGSRQGPRARRGWQGSRPSRAASERVRG
jgi:D-arabinose 1-dehydrogenase-like Zn-dependent alcohol dehydrogenase